VTLDEVYDAIGQFPEGLTSKQIADFLGKSPNQVSGVASKLFHYGKVDRDFAGTWGAMNKRGGRNSDDAFS
jgi:hypothetical protein